MCIALLSTAHPDYPLILINNRDEFLDRPSARADWWDPPSEHVLGGRDLQSTERGTWLAITKQGRVAVLTNFREEGVEKARDKSRGGIMNAYLTMLPGSSERPQQFARRLLQDVGVQDVGGFSMVFGELRAPSSQKQKDKDGSMPGLSVLSNRSASADNLTHIASQIGETHGLSNSHFGDTSWPKVVHGEKLLDQAIKTHIEHGGDQEDLIDSLFSILSTDSLPKRRQGEEWNTYVRQMRNSIFIPPVGGEAVQSEPADLVATAASLGVSTPDHRNGEVQVHKSAYGTQKQSVVLVDRSGKVMFVERTLYDESGRPKMKGSDRDRVLNFEIDGWFQ